MNKHSINNDSIKNNLIESYSVIWPFIFTIASSLLIIFGIWFNSNYDSFVINGDSMEPSLTDGEFVLIEKKDVFERNQIAFFKNPWSSEDVGILSKRVIAVPGDTVFFNKKFITVNGQNIHSFDTPCGNSEIFRVTLKNEIVVISDNVGLDSRFIYCNDGDPTINIENVVSHGEIFWSSE